MKTRRTLPSLLVLLMVGLLLHPAACTNDSGGRDTCDGGGACEGAGGCTPDGEACVQAADCCPGSTCNAELCTAG